jgi:hypothetical protein
MSGDRMINEIEADGTMRIERGNWSARRKPVAVGRAVAQAVRRWLPTAAARVRVWAACGVCGGQIGTGAGFLRVLRFPVSIISPISPSS